LFTHFLTKYMIEVIQWYFGIYIYICTHVYTVCISTYMSVCVCTHTHTHGCINFQVPQSRLLVNGNVCRHCDVEVPVSLLVVCCI
jgi:hypothetical protein